LNKTLEVVRETMQAEQKETSRCLAPHIQEQLVEGYDRAMEERGTGSVARQKACFHNFIDSCKDEVFDDGADVLMERLTKAADSIAEALGDSFQELAEKIEVSIAVLWEGARDDPKQVRARMEVLDVVATILGQVRIWTEAQKLHREKQIASQGFEDTDVDMA